MAKKKVNWDEMKVERRERSKHEGSTFERVFAIILTGIFVMPLWAIVHAIRWDYRWGVFGRDTDDRLTEGSDDVGWPEKVVGFVFWLVLVPLVMWLYGLQPWKIFQRWDRI